MLVDHASVHRQRDTEHYADDLSGLSTMESSLVSETVKSVLIIFGRCGGMIALRHQLPTLQCKSIGRGCAGTAATQWFEYVC